MPRARQRGGGELKAGLKAALLAALLATGLAAALPASGLSAPCPEALASVARVVDGDTIVVEILEAYKERYGNLAGARERVRLADVDAPELGTPEGEASRAFLRDILPPSRSVLLDIDDLRVRDRHGRIVAVVLIPHNETHLLNLNLLLALSGRADIVDHPNEFDPRGWGLYVEASACGTRAAASARGDGLAPWALAALAAAVLVIVAVLAILAPRRGRGP